MFEAYPRQHRVSLLFRPPVLLACAGFGLCFFAAFYGAPGRPELAPGLEQLDVKQARGPNRLFEEEATFSKIVPVPRPVRSTSSKPGKRQPVAAEDPEESPESEAQLPDLSDDAEHAAVPSGEEHDTETVESLRNRLEVERARGAAQKAELQRLRESVARAEAAQAEAVTAVAAPATAVAGSTASAATSSGAAAAVAVTMVAGKPAAVGGDDEPAAVPSKAAAVAAAIPAELWRRPPGEDPGGGDVGASTTVATGAGVRSEAIAAAIASGGGIGTDAAATPPAARQDHADAPRITVRTDSGDIVVQLGHGRGERPGQAAASSGAAAAPPAPQPSAVAAAPGLAATPAPTAVRASPPPPTVAPALLAGGGDSGPAVPPPAEPLPEAALPALALAAGKPPAAEAKPNRITVKHGEHEIVVQFGDEDGHGGEKSRDADTPTTATTTWAAVALAAPTVPAAAASPSPSFGQASGLQGGGTQAAPALAPLPPVTPAPGPMAASAATAEAAATGKGGGTARGGAADEGRSEAAERVVDRGTSITVTSQGKSITIKVGGGEDQKSGSRDRDTPVATTTTPLATTWVVSTTHTVPNKTLAANEEIREELEHNQDKEALAHDAPLLPRAASPSSEASTEVAGKVAVVDSATLLGSSRVDASMPAFANLAIRAR